MHLRNIPGFVVLVALLFSCEDDAEITASIEGKWKGTLAEIRVKPLGLPIPISEDYASFDPEIEFMPAGTVVLWDDSQPKEGTYELTGEKLTINIDYTIEDVDLSGTYTIETLTENSLVFYLERKGQTLVDPDGAPTIKGRVKVTLHFRRI